MRYSFCIRQGYEIDFLISTGDKICPVEVKSGNYRNHKSLDNFCRKFSSRIRDKYVVQFVGWGTFDVQKRAARTGRNPQTGKEIKIAAKKVVKFKVGKKLAEKVAK